MPTRRTLLAAMPALLTVAAAPARTFTVTAEQQASFSRYIAGVKEEARAQGISPAVLDHAFAGVRINGRVIELDRNQPEVTFTWTEYRTRIVSDSRVNRGREQYARHRDLLRRVEDAYGVPAPIIVGLWGLESDYGHDLGNFNVIEAVATLAWEGRRGAYFRGQLMDCLKILQAGDIQPAQMRGSWAGAMGQTQFMPDTFLKYAVDFNHTGKRDLWNDFACVFASTANNIKQDGWRAGVPWGWRVTVPPGIAPALIGRSVRRPVSEWVSMGVRRQDGAAIPPGNTPAALVRPGAPDDPDTYLVYASQFGALWAYNPSEKYVLCIGLLADRIGA